MIFGMLIIDKAKDYIHDAYSNQYSLQIKCKSPYGTECFSNTLQISTGKFS